MIHVPAALPAGKQHSGQQPAAAIAPAAPISLQTSGLSLIQVCDLILKQLYLQGSLLGVQFAQHARLPFNVIDEALRFLRDEKCLEVGSGEVIGRASYRFQLTDLGRIRAREAFEQCRYVGPAPVSLEAYFRQCSIQGVNQAPSNRDALEETLRNMVLRPGLLEELGPALCSGQAIFLHGPPGNGKTLIAKGLGQFLNLCGGEIYIPYAIHTENSIITIFDPALHTAIDADRPDGSDRNGNLNSRVPGQFFDAQPDLRWRRIRRPVIVTGGELTLPMLELRHQASSNYYQAPLHIKANGGVFVLDDFGRQLVSPRDLLNRWILPLEERRDHLTLMTGKTLAVPFEQLVIFSTNLDPRELVDDAFLRRIRHKIRIAAPTREDYLEIFRAACEQLQTPFLPEALDFLFTEHYGLGRPLRSSDPRDLLEILQSICRFRNQEVRLSAQLLQQAAQQFFGQL